MRKLTRRSCLIAALLFIAAATTSSSAAAPRPWLCRNIPVFSGVKTMSWSATTSGPGEWLMTFMHYDPSGGHDGFSVVATSELHARTEGTLEAGQYYAVAMHRTGEHWICPADASEDDSVSSGVISSLCYGRDEDSCDVKLVVRAMH